MARTSMYFEDFDVEQTFYSGGRTLTEGEIIAFAHMYDPQTMHIDSEWAKDGPFGGLIASGFQTLGIAWWLFLRMGLVLESMFVGVGVDHLRWTQPVRPGDTLSLTVTIRNKGEVRSGKGLITFGHELKNQNGDTVMTYTSQNLIHCRPPQK
ncbi:MAG: acyl dehydratase [Sulfobacillus benefaciens]|uniref:Acyl dehydratase n=1 Tax=Sulfobacillus benefaciens TaxID=453960 RepID=A0A2T2X9L8_9FIRM|nr:MAG: acyl dehydratase [Sulfobacillus benefaciens]